MVGLLLKIENNLTQLEDFARTHDGKLPEEHSWSPDPNEPGFLRAQVAQNIGILKSCGIKDHPLFQRYKKLHNQHLKLLTEEKKAASKITGPKEQDLLPETNFFQPFNSTFQRHVEQLAQDLDLLETFVREHNGKLPDTFTSGSILRRKITRTIADLKKRNLADHPLIQRYHQLRNMYERQHQENRAKQKILEKQKLNQLEEDIRQQNQEYKQQKQEEFSEQEKAWREEVAEWEEREKAQEKFDKITDRNAAQAAQRAETILFLEQEEPTEEFIEKLLRFYNKADPFEDNTFDADIVFNTPAQWVYKLEKFIEQYHRAPIRFYEITNQQMLNEHRLAKAVYGLINRLPATSPDRQRIEQLLAEVSEEK